MIHRTQSITICNVSPLLNCALKAILISISLSLMIGRSAQAQASLGEDISYEYLEKLIVVAKANYPKMKAYQQGVEIANLGLKKAKLSYFEILSFSYLFSPTGTQAALNPAVMTGYQFGLFMNIGAILQKPGLIKQAKGEVKVAQYEQDTYDLNLEAEVKKRYYTYVKQKVLFRLKSETLLDIESMLKEVRYKYENGTETLDNYNKVLIMYSENMAGKLGIESDLYIAQSNLEEILGQKLSTIE